MLTTTAHVLIADFVTSIFQRLYSLKVGIALRSKICI